ncbi:MULTISPECIES: glycoside hydrolase family 25 protein [Mumia]|uniref:Glycoside hydrolase family 25 protein n=1 Tax=Mumia xiangluensis TaxID=1678900 RepID=A0ABW1QPX0_9ACTN|nr:MULTISPECIES: glycoside hydrolase family 25 protein [Mumia]
MATPLLALAARRALVVLLALGVALGAAALALPSSASAATAVHAAAPASIADEHRVGAARGIDVSGHQHPRNRAINFTKVRRAGFTYAFIKATEGRGFVNEWARADGRASARAGLATGFYHFARPSSSARRQAQHFLREVRRTGVRSPMLVLDLETTDGRSRAHLRAWSRTWLATVERATGERPILYTGPGFWKGSVAGSQAFSKYPLWVAHYETKSPTVPGPWRRYAIWQHSDSGRVAGVPGRVDVNVAPRAVAERLAPPQSALARVAAARTAKAKAARTPAAAERSADASVSRGGERPKAGPAEAKAKAGAPSKDRAPERAQGFVARFGLAHGFVLRTPIG